MVGPLTNLALGYTMYGEDFGKSIKDVYIMGGNYQGVGNSSRAAEFNFHSDPEAAHAVLLKTRCPITILPWETCTKERFHIPIVSNKAEPRRNVSYLYQYIHSAVGLAPL